MRESRSDDFTAPDAISILHDFDTGKICEKSHHASNFCKAEGLPEVPLLFSIPVCIVIFMFREEHENSLNK